jgi:copper oxidase (laccase) domain-containing protein
VNLVRALREQFGSEPARCLAGVGPTIGARRYPVGPRVPAAFLSRRPWARDFVTSIEGHFHFDLAGANARFLLESGIPSTAIEACRLCTYDSVGLLHSFRRDGTGAGHHGMIAAWRE